MTQQEMHAEIAAAYVQDGEDAAFLDPATIALILQLLQGFLAGCFPAGVMLAIRFPRVSRWESRWENYVAGQKAMFQQDFDLSRVVETGKRLSRSATIEKVQAIKAA